MARPTIPNQVRHSVVKELYRRADEIGWDGLSSSERTETYDQFLNTPEVGGVLTRYLTRERARTWMKDGPMKEFARAQEGIGPYAQFVVRRTPGPAALVRHALGDDWRLVEGSLLDKPNRCRAIRRDEIKSVMMIWGRPERLRDLIWSGILTTVEGDGSVVIVITTRQGELLSPGDIERHRRIGSLVGFRVEHAEQRMITNRAAEER